MYWYLIAMICLLAGAILLIRYLVLRKKADATASADESPAGGETLTVFEGARTKDPAKSRKAKRCLILGIVLLVLTEAAILLGNHFAA